MLEPQICPSILSCDPANFIDPVREMVSGGCDWIHLDVMDGQFVPPITFGADLAASLCRKFDCPVEAHLMTMTPEAHLDAFIQAGCKRILFHAEAAIHGHRLCQSLRERGVESGVAINPGTPIEAVLPVLEVADMVLVMTVNPGWGGQKLINECIDKVSALRKIAPDMPIEVDGGIAADTIRTVFEAGATHFVAGSYLMKSPTIAAGIAELKRACV